MRSVSRLARGRASRLRRRSRVAYGGVLAVAFALGLSAIAVDVLAPPADAPVPDRVNLAAATAGAWYCPVGASESESAVVSVGAVGDEPSRVTLQQYGRDGLRRGPRRVVPPGQQVQIPLAEGRAQAPVAVYWQGGPVAVTYRLQGGRQAAAPCVSGPAPRWYLTGFDTTLGSRSILHLFNPYSIDAVARVRYGTSEGPVDLVLTENVAVEAGRSVRLNLRRYQPEQENLGVVVEALAGRLIAQGEVRLAPPSQERGPTGRVLLPAVEAPAPSSAYAYASNADGATSWLSVFNPTSREAAVELVASDPPRSPSSIGEVSVPAGGTVRIDLEGLSAATTFGLAVVSVNDVPVVTARLTDVRRPDARAVAGSTGAVQAASWALPGAETGGRARSDLYLYNPGSEAVAVAVAVGDATPEEWRRLQLPPNGHMRLRLPRGEGGQSTLGAFVEADAPVVAELSTSPVGARFPSSSFVGVPAAAWRGVPSRPAVRRDSSLDTLPAADGTPSEPSATAAP